MKPTPSAAPNELVDDSATPAADTLVCVMTFNANDASGAAGLAADVTAIASVGAHPLPVTCGVWLRDSTDVHDHYALADDCVEEQARTVLEDMPVQAIKVGFVGSPANLGTIAEIASDYAEIPLVAYLPDLSWWEDDKIDQYLDAFAELLLPQASLLVGNHSTLWRWLLPDWEVGRSSPGARDLAAAAAELGAPYVLVTGTMLPDQYLDNVLASAQTVLASRRYERLDARFVGAGDTLAATLTALLASGRDLAEATLEALDYLDGCLVNGFHPGMGHLLPDRMFWAQPDEDDADDDAGTPNAPSGLDLPPHDTQH